MPQLPRRMMGRQLLSASFLLLFLLAVLMPSAGNALPTQNRSEIENRCQCITAISFVPPRSVDSVRLIQSGPHCSVLEVIATLKNGREVCLDPASPQVKHIVQVLLNKVNH